MPIRLSDLQKDERTCTVEYGGETCEVTYRPSGYTPLVESQLQDEAEAGKPGLALAGLLSKILIGWEVMDGEKKVPTTYNSLVNLPEAFLVAVVNKITDDVQVGREDRKNSGGGSLRRANKENARGGTR